MNLSQKYITLFIGLGTLIAVTLRNLWDQLAQMAVSDEGQSVPMWYMLGSAPIDALVSIAPGFIVAFIARSHGALIGFSSGLLGGFLYTAFTSVVWSNVAGTGFIEYASLTLQLLLLSLGSGIIGLVAGMAGQNYSHAKKF